jgi:hypothetical protein
VTLLQRLRDWLFDLLDTNARPTAHHHHLDNPDAQELAGWLRIAGLDPDDADTRAAELLADDAPALAREIGRDVTVVRFGTAYMVTWPHAPDPRE